MASKECLMTMNILNSVMYTIKMECGMMQRILNVN